MTITRNIGMLLLSIFLILYGLGVFGIAVGAPILGILALLAGIFILIGR